MTESGGFTTLISVLHGTGTSMFVKYHKRGFESNLHTLKEKEIRMKTLPHETLLL